MNRAIKRIIDLLLALIGLILLSPLLIIASWQIHHFDKGPVFFTQERIGKKGKPFAMVKLRTMRLGAADEQNSLDIDKENVAGNSVLFKLKDDPRITKPGRWLRRYSVDEVPQLLNVMIGNMSIVGPRPPLQQEVDQYDEFVTSRFIVKPGLTGLWQISGRSELDWEESIRADLNYVQNWSIMFDLVIIWRTIKTVLSGKGAY
jgi:lipopolysaccharide/colanic/teichoic acid biosynthesis glycosyltransferase